MLLNEWEDNGEISCGPEDHRPEWAKKIQGYHSNWSMIDYIKKVVGEIPDNADVSVRTRKVRIGDTSYVCDVYLNGEYVGTYSY